MKYKNPSGNMDETKEICIFDNRVNPTSCNARARICNELSTNNCNPIINYAQELLGSYKCFKIKLI